MSEKQLSTPYKIPERPANMTIHHMYGITKPREGDTTVEFLNRHHFGLLGDLLVNGVSYEDIETAVNTSEVSAANWPEREPVTTLLWNHQEETKAELEQLAEQAVQGCYGGEHDPLGGNFATVGALIGNQQLALAGLIYARDQGKLREITELSDPQMGTGPLYVVRDSFSAKMFDILIPEE